MDQFNDRVCVVTGAASGIGLALAERFAQLGMKVVLADVEVPALEQAEDKLKSVGADTFAVPTDVSQWESVSNLADAVYDRFGAVHILCNNAGVAGSGVAVGGIWERDLADWEWVLGVNLWGVIHGVHAFLPRMVRAGTESHVINTASAAGLSPGSSIYGVTKHAVVAFSEALHSQLAIARANIGVSVLCPGYVKTNIMDSGRNRPGRLAGQGVPSGADVERRDRGVADLMRMGMEPLEVAEEVLSAVLERRLYVLPMKPAFKERFLDVIRRRAAAVIEGRNPTPAV
jgi:NAD(P)-dependent dehydrogenase (short-subunit alcohol dehydrogenase family)